MLHTSLSYQNFVLPINIDTLIQAIIGIISPTTLIRNKFQRNERVIELLKKFNLSPEHPSADFSTIYAYTLVEYGVGKKKQLLELFRQENIKLAFRKALDHNNPLILLSEVDAFLDTYTLGDEIRTLGLDVRREVAAFATIFIEVAKRSRTPADVLMNQEMGSLHKSIASIQEQMDRLQTLEGIRTQMARRAAQNHPALLKSSTSTENKCRAIALAQQMRGWFETLNYRLEKYEVWEDSYFEWIINIQSRNRYDRIIVRGIAGEVGLSDVIALRSSLEKQRTDGGWLVTARRISRVARDEVEKKENRHLNCYTFDELIDQDVNFGSYIDWLKAEIKLREIDEKYVPLACTKEEIDPVTKRRVGVSRYDERYGWIDGYIDLWLDDPAKEHISVLGEFGTGKTWFALHYAWTALQRYCEAKKRGVERPRLPLVIPLRDYTKAVSVESLFSEFFFRKHEMPIPGYSVFEQLNRMGKLLFIFDGFDEMAARVDRQQMINNFWELTKIVVPGSKVILTCRTEHFPDAKEGRALLNAELQASTARLGLTGETPQFEVLELEKFNDEQIRQVLSHKAERAIVEQVMGNPQLRDLARRPVMTELILEALPDIEAGKPVDMPRVYLYAVCRKMEKDIKAERTFTSQADKLYFLCELFWEMFLTERMSLNYRHFPDRIRGIFGHVVQEEKYLDHWHFDMMGQTMLIRNADGDYTPSHRSLLEFFVAYKFAAELGSLANDFTKLAQAQSHIDNDSVPCDYTWSSYFRRKVDKAGEIVTITPLKKFVSEPLEHLQQTFGRLPLTKAVIDLLLPMLDIDPSITLLLHHPIINILKSTRGKTKAIEAEVGYVGGNAATLLVKVDKTVLETQDLSHTVIKGADFTSASLQNTNLTGAYLGNSLFKEPFGNILSVAFSGEFLAVGSSDGKIYLFQGQRRFIYKGHTHWVRSIAFSPDGQRFASGSEDQTIRIWDIKTSKFLSTLEGHGSCVRSVTFSDDGKLLASGSEDGTVKIWNVDTGQYLETLTGHAGKVWSVTFEPVGKLLASCGEDNTLKIWDVQWNVQTGECRTTLSTTLLGHENWVRSVNFNSNGQQIVSGSDDKTVKIWDVRTGKCRMTLRGHENWVRSVAFSPDGQQIVSGSDDHTVRIWDAQTGQCQNILSGHDNRVWSVAFSLDGQRIASGSDDQTVRTWDAQTGQCLSTLGGYSNWILSVAFSPDSSSSVLAKGVGGFLASGGEDKVIRIWDLHTRKITTTLRGHTSRIWSVAFSADSRLLASGSDDHTVRIWDLKANGGNQCLQVLTDHNHWVRSVAFSPVGQLLASGSDDHTVRIWDIYQGISRKVLRGHTNWVRSVAFSPDGQFIASGSDDRTIRIWNVHSYASPKILQGHQNVVRAIAFSPDGQIIASGSNDHTVKIWDVHTGECITTLTAHKNWVHSVAFSSDGQILVSGCQDGTIYLWNVRDQKPIKFFQEDANEVLSVAFSPDGQQIASGIDNGIIHFRSMDKGEFELPVSLKIPKPYEGMNITSVVGLTEDQRQNLRSLGAIEMKQT